MPHGYSGTPLPKKLGIGPGHVVAVLDAPPDLADTLGELPEGVRLVPELVDDADIVLIFARGRAALEPALPAAAEVIFPAGAIWVAWPKRASKVPTDMTEDVVRELALPRGLVDNKVCAIDATWSGLRVVWRRELRNGPG